jgi:hypothetical protein
MRSQECQRRASFTPRLDATRAANHLKYLFVASGLCPRPLAPHHYSEVLIDRIGRYVNPVGA